MTFALSLPQAVAASLVLWMLWRLLRPLVVKSPLSLIPGPPSSSWWKGNFHKVYDREGWEYHNMLLKNYGGVARLNMLLGDEQLYIADPLALYYILVKEQATYSEPDMFISSINNTFGPNLISVQGEQHKKQRKMLNPAFSTKYLRELVPLFHRIAYQFRDVLAKRVHNGEKEVNIVEWVSRASLECIGQGGVGYSFNALSETSTSKYKEAIKTFSPIHSKLFLPRMILPWVENIGSPQFRRKVVELIPSKLVQTMVNIVDVMDSTSQEIFQQKRLGFEQGDKAILEQVGEGKDMMSVLMRANMAAEEADRLPEAEIICQMNVFLFAGHDTTTLAISRILDKLASHQDVQGKLREEVTTARKEHGDLDYETLMSLPYLDAVVRETLRLYPLLSQLMRVARKDAVLPFLWPVQSVDGKSEIKEIVIPKNTGFMLSIIGINRSKRIWGEDAEEWKPERWLRPLPKSVSDAHIPGVFASTLTFSGGARSCIGYKFAEMEIKLILSVLLESLKFTPGSKEVFWAMGFLTSPVLKGSKDLEPDLPMKVSLVAH